jgi:hypothetical protein
VIGKSIFVIFIVPAIVKFHDHLSMQNLSLDAKSLINKIKPDALLFDLVAFHLLKMMKMTFFIFWCLLLLVLLRRCFVDKIGRDKYECCW